MTKREEKAAEKKVKVESLAADLKARAATFRESDETFLAHLRTASKFYRYSVNNQFLIMLQSGGTVAVRSFKQWLELGRQVRKGESCIYILAPRPYMKENTRTGEEEQKMSFKFVPVFPYERTDPIEGFEHPWEPYEFPTLTEDVGHEYIDALIASLQSDGHTIIEIEGENRLGRFYVPKDGEDVFRLEVDRTQPALQVLQTMVHELAHAMHWVLQPETLRRWPKERVEFVAEASAYAVLTEIGFDASGHAVSYVAGMGLDEVRNAEDEKREKIVMALIVDIVGLIMGRLESLDIQPVVIDVEQVA